MGFLKELVFYMGFLKEVVFETFKDAPKELKEDWHNRWTEGREYVVVEASHAKINNGKPFLGLFKGGIMCHSGHGMGWYGSEYYRFTKCIATSVGDCSMFFPKIYVTTFYMVPSFRAKTDKDAIQKFYSQFCVKDSY